jgi:hypothetical protein
VRLEGLAVLPAGELLVIDAAGPVRMLDSQGRVKHRARRGGGPGEFEAPGLAGAFGDSIWTWDAPPGSHDPGVALAGRTGDRSRAFHGQSNRGNLRGRIRRISCLGCQPLSTGRNRGTATDSYPSAAPYGDGILDHWGSVS